MKSLIRPNVFNVTALTKEDMSRVKSGRGYKGGAQAQGGEATPISICHWGLHFFF